MRKFTLQIEADHLRHVKLAMQLLYHHIRVGNQTVEPYNDGCMSYSFTSDGEFEDEKCWSNSVVI